MQQVGIAGQAFGGHIGHVKFGRDDLLQLFIDQAIIRITRIAMIILQIIAKTSDDPGSIRQIEIAAQGMYDS